MVLLAIRLKPRLLVSFSTWQKRFILTEYVIDLSLYAYFIMGSKAGSLASKFVELFTGWPIHCGVLSKPNSAEGGVRGFYLRCSFSWRTRTYATHERRVAQHLWWEM
jgi:hypothetical protein